MRSSVGCMKLTSELSVIHYTGNTDGKGVCWMRVTTKGQVTIPQNIREKFGIGPSAEVDFAEENGRVYLIPKVTPVPENRFRRFRGIATVKMTTDEIMSLTRGDK